jgi:general secretion pathway protein H
MSAIGSEPITREAGFSLLEVVAALAIVAFAARLVAVNISKAPGPATVAAVAALLATEARAARANAIRRGTDTTFDVTASADRAARRAELRIGRDIALEATVAADVDPSRSRPMVRFFPDGSSTGGTIRLSRGATAMELRINWLSGRVHVSTVE